MTFRAGTEWDAQDIVQESYCRAIKYFNSYDGVHLEQWFYTIMNNTLKDFKRNQMGLVTVSFEEEELEGLDCTSLPESVMREIKEHIDYKVGLPQREVLTKYFVDGFTVREISEITGYSLEAAYKLVKRFRNELEGRYG